MYNTYKNLKPLARKLKTAQEKSTEHFNLMALEYQITGDQTIFATIYCEMFPYLAKNRERFHFTLNNYDIASYSLESLQRALMDYSVEGGAGIRTLYVRYLKGRFQEHVSMCGNKVRRANYNTTQFRDEAVDEEGYAKAEILQSLEQSAGTLSENEIKYCTFIMRETEHYKDSEIATMLGISPAAIHYIKKSLQKKLHNEMEYAF